MHQEYDSLVIEDGNGEPASTRSQNQISVSVPDLQSVLQFGNSAISLGNQNPLNYADRLCRLVNAKEKKRLATNEIETIDKLPSMIHKIYLKIRS